MGSEKTQFKPGQSGNPKGREPLSKAHKTMKKMNQATIIETFNRYMGKDVDTLKRIFKEKRVPAADMMVISCMLKAISKGDHKAMETMFTRTGGRPPVDLHLSSESFADYVKRMSNGENIDD